MAPRFWAAGGTLSGYEIDELPGGRQAANRVPSSQDGIEWPEGCRAAKRTPNGQEESEHRMVPSRQRELLSGREAEQPGRRLVGIAKHRGHMFQVRAPGWILILVTI